MGRKLLTPEFERAICERYEQVEVARILVDEFGVSDQTVYRVLEKHGIPRTHRHPKKKSGTGSNHKDIDRSKVGELFKSGMSVRAIARQLGCSGSTIYHHLDKLGLYKVGQRKAAHDEMVPRILELYEQGLSDYEISERLGCGRSLVNDRLRKHGIRRGRGGNSHKGGAVIHERAQKAAIERFDSVREQFELIEYTNADHATVRCRTCGCEFNWCRDTWDAIEKCPTCRDRKAEIERSRRRASKIYNAAAREWLLSTPRVCKECGEPFYSEHENAAYCCDACRKRASYRRKSGKKANNYRHRMRIEVTRLTYDRTVTLDAVYRKFHGRCCECGCETERTSQYNPRMATLDHIVALGNNGTHTWDNVQLLCSDCNSKKRDLGQMRLPMAV